MIAVEVGLIGETLGPIMQPTRKPTLAQVNRFQNPGTTIRSIWQQGHNVWLFAKFSSLQIVWEVPFYISNGLWLEHPQWAETWNMGPQSEHFSLFLRMRKISISLPACCKRIILWIRSPGTNRSLSCSLRRKATLKSTSLICCEKKTLYHGW